MKLATASYGFRQWSIDNYLYAAAGLGVGSAEIGYTSKGTLQELYLVSSNRPQMDGIARVKALARDAGVEMAASVVNYRLWGTSPTALAWAKANIRLDIEIGAMLGLQVMRVTEIGYPPSTPEAQVFDEVGRVGIVLNELAEYAQAFGVTIVAENFRASSDLMLAVASHFTSPAVGLHYDPHNYCRVGEDPAEALRKTKHHVKYVHLKDYRKADGQILATDTWWPSWAVGEGEIDWRSVLQELRTFYKGLVAIEYEKTLDDVLRGMKSGIGYVRRLFRELDIAEE